VATRAPQVPTIEAAALTFHAAAAGDKISNVRQPRTVIVFNDSDSSVTATIEPPGKTAYGVDNPDKVLTCAANSYTTFRVLPSYRDPEDSNLVSITWSATTDVSWAVIS
jgi:hypothetical protein